MDFLVKQPPREVLNRAETYLLRRRFRMSLSERTDTTALFTRIYPQRKGFLRTLLNAFVRSPSAMQKVWLVASEAGEESTRLTVIEKRQGEWPDEWVDIKSDLEQWVVGKLGGAYWLL